jgi:uncharacterized protein (TIGR02186 family)
MPLRIGALSIRPVAFALAIALLAFPAGAPLAAEDDRESIQVDTSDREIAIESDFTGAKITVFGAVDNSRQEAANSGYYDIIIVIRGPSEYAVAREKQRVAGIWVNGRSAAFTHVPSFYAVLSTRPLDEIAEDSLLRRYGIEFNPKATASNNAPPPDEFENAIIAAKKREQLYIEDPFAVAFLGKSLFRGTVTLPAKVKVGNYSSEVYLLHEGRLLTQHYASLRVHKAGIERELTALAYNRPWIYGLLSVVIAVVCGLIGWTLFSRT